MAPPWAGGWSLSDACWHPGGHWMPRHASTAPTERKQVHLTPDARTTIQAWADREGLTFSAAIEALARRGLRRAPAGTTATPAPASGTVGTSSGAASPERD